jgi:hypothetical protein
MIKVIGTKTTEASMISYFSVIIPRRLLLKQTSRGFK